MLTYGGVLEDRLLHPRHLKHLHFLLLLLGRIAVLARVKFVTRPLQILLFTPNERHSRVADEGTWLSVGGLGGGLVGGVVSG